MRLADLVIDELEATRGADVSTRWELRAREGLNRFEVNGPLLPLFFTWNGARQDNAIPTKAQFQPAETINADSDSTSVVTVGDGGFQLFRFGVLALDWTKGIESENERAWLEQDLYVVMARQTPAYHHIDQYIDGTRRRFTRLMLPVGGDKVSDIVVAENNDIIPVAVSRVS